MTDPKAHDGLDRLHIRTYRPEDLPAIRHLYEHGTIVGHADPYDTAADIDNISEAYFSDPLDHFWVAEHDRRVIGMIAVSHEDRHTAHIRRLRVDKGWQHTAVAHRLIETALTHCRKLAFLKVVFETRFEKTAAVDLFTRLGFLHTRTKSIHNRDLLEFYLDLYRTAKENAG